MKIGIYGIKLFDKSSAIFLRSTSWLVPSNMPSLAVFITVTILLNGIFCRPAKELDVSTILKILQGQKDLQQRHGDQSSSSDSSDNDNLFTLHNREPAKLVQEVLKRDRRKDRLIRYDDDTYRYKFKNNKEVQDQYNEYTVGNRDQERNKLEEGNQDNKKSFEQILEGLVAENMLDKKSLANKRKLKHLPTFTFTLDSLHRDKNDDFTGNLNKYSKIFVVLNPHALETSKNKNELADLISRIVSVSALNEDGGLLGSKYREFPVKSNFFSRRLRSNSNEVYAKESVEDDYKLKRFRNDRGGGGGGTRGRTALPYIRHRGIYESS